MGHFLGIDIGSSYTKYLVIDTHKKILLRSFVKTLSRNKDEEISIQAAIEEQFFINHTGVTGYGRVHYKYADVLKTELYCASQAISELYPIDKLIIDIGGEDIKIINSSANGKVKDFFMNSKCAAGTGSFITETAERAEINLTQMSALAEKSTLNRELNSFCTVFAKTEVMQWILEGVSIEDIAKGIYISTVNRIKKIPVNYNLPVFLIGGVVKYHPYIRVVLAESIGTEVIVPEQPQFINAFGASLFAFNEFNNK